MQTISAYPHVSERGRASFNRVMQAPQLSSQEEMALADRIARGDSKAVDELVIANARLAFHLARKYHWAGLEMDDLFSEGLIGLRTAASRFECRGAKFSVFAAWHIRAAIQRYITKFGRSYRVPKRIADLAAEARKIRLGLADGMDLTPEMLVDRLGVSDKTAYLVLQALQPTVTLDAPLNDTEGNRTFSDVIADESAQNGASESNTHDRLELLEKLLGVLSDREQYVIIRRFGLREFDAMTLAEVGDSLQVTRERVRQIESKALRKLRVAEERRARQEQRFSEAA